MIFCSSVKHSDHLVKFVPDSLTIHSKIPQKERDVRLEMFRQNMLNTVITVDCFNEGIDIPRANVIVFLRSTASATIFLQQLGRGLTKTEGKDRVVILDFVANIERIRTVQEMHGKVMEYMRAKKSFEGSKEVPPPIMLEVGKVMFMMRKIDLTDLLERIVKRDPYSTCQEASEAARRLEIKSGAHYARKYKRDQKLPSEPNVIYSDFPGWERFLGTERNYYPTWQEASKVALSLGINSKLDYHKKYKLDDRLPSHPQRTYADFPGWIVFLKLRDYYPTWQEASEAAQKIGIRFIITYLRGDYKADPRLPPRPDEHYPNYPGGIEFFGRKKKEFYSTWEQASCAAKVLGFQGKEEYIAGYKVDEKLPSNPQKIYSDFPGWLKFLGKT